MGKQVTAAYVEYRPKKQQQQLLELRANRSELTGYKAATGNQLDPGLFEPDLAFFNLQRCSSFPL